MSAYQLYQGVRFLRLFVDLIILGQYLQSLAFPPFEFKGGNLASKSYYFINRNLPISFIP